MLPRFDGTNKVYYLYILFESIKEKKVNSKKKKKKKKKKNIKLAELRISFAHTD